MSWSRNAHGVCYKLEQHVAQFFIVQIIVMEELMNKETMSSLQIAEITGMRHSDVMRSIRNMEKAWVNIAQRNFARGSYTDANNQSRPCYYLTKTECLYIATKFNDEARAKLVIRWEALETGKEKPISSTQPLSQAEMFLQLAQMNVENERKMKELEAKTEELQSELTEIKQRTTTDLHQSTIVAYVTRNHIKLDVTKYGAMGRKATSICKKRGIEVTKINDVRWGKVSVYPDSVLEEVFKINN